MATYQIVYWQDIPSLVEARGDDGVSKAPLGDRFQELIDLAAMRQRLAGTDAYLEQWSKGPRRRREGSAAAVAAAVRDELEARYDALRAAVLAKPAPGEP